jgi:signal transduction histidine kinase
MEVHPHRSEYMPGIRQWAARPPVGALLAAVILAMILLPYWWLAVSWSGHALSSPDLQFTFAVTSFLLVLIVADSAFLVRYYQLVRKRELAHATEELSRSEDALRLSVKKLNLLSSITRHDVLNQIMALGAYLELTRMSVTDPVVRDYIEKEKLTLKRIEEQINFTRDYEGLGMKSPVWQNAREKILQACNSLNLGAVNLNISFGDLEIYADPLLVKVFFNLAGNALLHGQEFTRIDCSAHERGDSLVLVVEDDGVGVPHEEKENIFTRRFYQHSGYGLFLSREILGITGITITETGEPGKGARFEILIPHGKFRNVDPKTS